MVSTMENESITENIQPAKKQKTSNGSYKAPSAEELYNLKNTESLYQSNLFRLQLTELIKEITVPEQKIDTYLKITNDLMKNLKTLKQISNIKFNDLKIIEKKNIQMPLIELCKQMEGTYSFLPPVNSTLVGSCLTNTLINSPRIKVDLCAEMPSEYFNERDYLNYRYFTKRNLYMSHTLAQLIDLKKYSNVKFEFESNVCSNFKPCLIMSFNDQSLDVCLHFVPQKGTFKENRFNPKQSNVRKEWFSKHFAKSDTLNETPTNSDETNPTPGYNFGILSDLRMKENNDLLKRLLTTKQITESIQMVKLWLFKRGLNTGFGGFDNFTLNMYFVFLLINRHINVSMSQYQIFRIALLNLAEANWHIKGVNMKDLAKNNSLLDDDISEVNLKTYDLTLEDFHKCYQVVFIDVSGYLNITANLSTNVFLRLKHEANVSVSLLTNEGVDCFDPLFICNHTMDIRFDALIRINNDDDSNDSFYQNILKKAGSSLAIESPKNQLVDSFNNSYFVAKNLIMNAINRSLDKRAHLIFAELISSTRFPIKSKKCEIIPSIKIGILFNEAYDNILIKGPASTSPQAVDFRNFWGKKSELRRFQDTTICEAVLFEHIDASSKRMVYSEIIKHILDLHFSIEQSHLNFCNQQLDSVLAIPNTISSQYGTGEERLANCLSVFEEFSKIIKNLKDLPLMINSVQGLSSTFRQSEVFASLPCCFKYDAVSEKNMHTKIGHMYVPKYPLGPVLVPYIKPLEIVCQLESSGKWPDDLECIKRLKSAFYLQILKNLRDNHGLTANTTVDYCDCLYKGFVFRIVLCTMSELLCIKSEINEHGVILTKESKQSLAYEKRMFHIPKLNSVLHGLQQKYNCFSGVCRLAKRWLASHFLLEYFEEEAIDLLCAYLFVQMISYEPPRSIIAGFHRFLDLMSNFDWKNQFLLINFNNDLTKEQITKTQLKFQEKRSSLPSVFIVTPYDAVNKDSMWTWEKPNIQQLCRTVVLARQSVQKLKYYMNNFDSNENFKNLFRPSLDIFDIKINLKPSYCVKAHQKIDICEGTFLPHYREYDANALQKDKYLPVVDFDPVRNYVEELRKSFDEMALFFYDIYGATQIFVLWKPETLQQKELKIQNSKYRLIDSVKNCFILNIEAVVDDFKIIGDELVESITIKNDSSIFK